MKRLIDARALNGFSGTTPPGRITANALSKSSGETSSDVASERARKDIYLVLFGVAIVTWLLSQGSTRDE